LNMLRSQREATIVSYTRPFVIVFKPFPVCSNAFSKDLICLGA
jgi:hypothetical protein